MRGVYLAWLAALGIISYREVKLYGKPPVPGRLAGASLLYAGLAAVAISDRAAPLASALGWGFVTAAALVPGVLPPVVGGTKAASSSAAPAGAADTTTTAGG